MADLTKKEAKKITLEVWRYLWNHPELGHKAAMPKRLYKKIEDLEGDCPLCELFDNASCSGCPLRDLADEGGDCEDYWDWAMAYNKSQRREAAGRIVNLVEDWETEE